MITQVKDLLDYYLVQDQGDSVRVAASTKAKLKSRGNAEMKAEQNSSTKWYKMLSDNNE